MNDPEIADRERRIHDTMPLVRRDRCPRCDSPTPRFHPAIQYEGEVSICRHPWHQATTTGWDKLGEFDV